MTPEQPLLQLAKNAIIYRVVSKGRNRSKVELISLTPCKACHCCVERDGGKINLTVPTSWLRTPKSWPNATAYEFSGDIQGGAYDDDLDGMCCDSCFTIKDARKIN